MFYAMLALINEGDEVIYPNPGFPIYESMARYVGGTPVAAPLREAAEFRMDVDEVASLVTDRTRLIVINSPQNPTGSILTADDIREIARIAIEHDLVVLADEIYGRLQYEGEPLSVATLPGMAERTITLDGFSKTFAMTGWRLGYGIVPDWLLPSFSRLVINSVSCTNAFAQAGAIAALTGPQDEPQRFREEFIARRRAHRGRAQRDRRRELRHAARRVLRLPQRVELRAQQRRDRRPPALRRRRLWAGRHRLRQPRRGLPASVVRQLRENISSALERIGESLAKLERTGELATADSVCMTATRPAAESVDALYAARHRLLRRTGSWSRTSWTRRST